MITNLNEFIAASKSFTMPEGKIEANEKGRLDFIAKFPLSSIQSLKIDEYCLGTTENSFCYWLEFKDILFGIGGGNASKFGIYKSKDGNYYQESGSKKNVLEGKVLDEAFSKIKHEIIQGLKYVEQNQIEQISSLQTSVWNMVLLKIFTLYYPERFLTIGDPVVITECARRIGVTGIEYKSENSILLNYLCRKKLNETEEFSDWEYEKIGTLVWETFRKAAKTDYYLIGSKYGKNADVDKLPEMLSRSVIATGFASELDLSEIYNENHSTIKAFLQNQNEEDNSVNALKHFLSMKPGDLVAVKGDGSPKGKEGYLSIVGIAEVVEKNGKVYEHDPNSLGHIIHVKFLNAPIFKELALGGYGRTVHKLSNDDHIKLIFKSDTEMNYYAELKMFLSQAQTNELKTSQYLKSYSDLAVKVSFGQGNQSKVPWIAFLNGIDDVQKGIYPVYLFYKEKKILILAYGVSETYPSNRKWNISNEKTIEQFFAENNFGRPDRYGSSYVFKSYDINKPIIEDEINKDLNRIISIYKATGGYSKPNPKELEDFKPNNFYNVALEAGYFINEKLSIRFISSLLTKPFVILTGLSGSGKTKLAQAFAMWLCEDEKQYCLVAVGADWTNREPLLGFPNALEQNIYVKPDNGVLDLIIEANKNENKPYFLILDEMNLSHVERYFADFLSVMESKNKIALHSGDRDWNDVPPQIGFPKNLFIIGTVNIDETTYMFSPKVLDRASVIEFRVTASEMESYLGSNSQINLKNLEGEGKNMAESFVKLAKDTSLETADKEGLNKTLISFFAELKKTGAEFGYRSASEILRFAAVANKLDADWKQDEITDAAIMQKLLPKVHGSRRKLEPVLKTLGNLCLNAGNTFEDYLGKKDNAMAKYPVSLEKIVRMHDNLLSNGFTSYAEA